MELLTLAVMGKPLLAWLVFPALVTGLLAFDLGVLHRRPHEIGARESLWLSAFYIAVGLAFAGWIYLFLGRGPSLEYLTGFLVEKSLAMDNIFVIATIVAYFSIPRHYQHRVLIYGILGVIILRAVMIFLGAALVSRFEWVLYIFAAFLIVVGIKMLFIKDKGRSLDRNPVLRFLRQHVPITEGLHGERFFVRQAPAEGAKPVLFITPLLVALIMIEIADVIFAVDSIPAIFAITTDPYIVYTSNIFAILGLRALYFALAVMIARFVYLKTALALILVFIGGKVFAAPVLGLEKVPAELSLIVTLTILAGGIGYSLWRTRRPPAAPLPSDTGPAPRREAA